MIGIITAMDKEYSLIKSALSEAKELCEYCVQGVLGQHHVVLYKSGIGKVNATLGFSELTTKFKDINKVISVGCAGAAQPDLEVGDIVVGNSYSYHDVYCGEGANGQIQGSPAVFHSDYLDVAGKIPECKLGMIVSGDWFVTTKEKVEEITSFLPKVYNVIAIDMESAALAHACQKRGKDFVSIRIISDNPLKPNQKKQYEGFWGDMAKEAFDVLTKCFE